MSTPAAPIILSMQAATVYIAPSETAKPAIQSAIDLTVWQVLATPYDLMAGKPITFDPMTFTIQEVMSEGSTEPLKDFLTAESYKLSLEVMNISTDFWRKISSGIYANNPAATGVPGYNEMGIAQGFNRSTYALVVEYQSVMSTNGLARLWIPRTDIITGLKPIWGKVVQSTPVDFKTLHSYQWPQWSLGKFEEVTAPAL